MKGLKHQHHGAPCIRCGQFTYRKAKVCNVCEPGGIPNPAYKRPRKLPDPVIWPEDYLERCARELLKRHAKRHALLEMLALPVTEVVEGREAA